MNRRKLLSYTGGLTFGTIFGFNVFNQPSISVDISLNHVQNIPENWDNPTVNLNIYELKLVTQNIDSSKQISIILESKFKNDSEFTMIDKQYIDSFKSSSSKTFHNLDSFTISNGLNIEDKLSGKKEGDTFDLDLRISIIHKDIDKLTIYKSINMNIIQSDKDIFYNEGENEDDWIIGISSDRDEKGDFNDITQLVNENNLQSEAQKYSWSSSSQVWTYDKKLDVSSYNEIYVDYEVSSAGSDVSYWVVLTKEEDWSPNAIGYDCGNGTEEECVDNSNIESYIVISNNTSDRTIDKMSDYTYSSNISDLEGDYYLHIGARGQCACSSGDRIRALTYGIWGQ